MHFELIKLIGGLLMPVPVIIALLVIGLVLLTVTRLHRVAFALLVSGTGLLLVVSTPIVPELTLNQLETIYPVLKDPPDAEWIICFGGRGERGRERQRDQGLGHGSCAE